MDRRSFLLTSLAALAARGLPQIALRGKWITEVVRGPGGMRVVQRWIAR